MGIWFLWTALVVTVLVAGFLVYLLLATRRIAGEAERLVPPGGSFVDVEGCRIHYVERGEGPVILMIHGLGGQHHHMRRPLMEEFGEGYRLIAMDRPGSGYSTRPKQFDGRLTEQARLVAGFIDALKLERPLLVGHSLGGAIALATALDHPDKISGLALIAPLTHFLDQLPPEFRALHIRSPLVRRFVSETMAIPASVRASEQTLAFVFGPQKPPADFAVAGGALAGLRPAHFYGTSTDMVAIAHDLPAMQRRYEEIAMPVGILFGDSDRVLSHAVHGLPMKERIANIDLEIAEGVGHMPQYAVTRQVVAFIRRIAARAFALEPAARLQ